MMPVTKAEVNFWRQAMAGRRTKGPMWKVQWHLQEQKEGKWGSVRDGEVYGEKMGSGDGMQKMSSGVRNEGKESKNSVMDRVF